MAAEGEKQGVRQSIDRYTGKLLKHNPGMSREQARGIAKKAALGHHHNERRPRKKRS